MPDAEVNDVPKYGLRELKKQRTRQTIQTAALALFEERGYARTTLEDIAEAAEVSTGTLFAYFPTKEDILFPEANAFYDHLKQQLERRSSETTTFDVLRDLLTTAPPPDENLRRRWKLLRDEGLHERQRARYLRVEHLLIDAIAVDLSAPPDDLRPTLLAASTTAALTAVSERLQPDTENAMSYEPALTILKQMFNLLRDAPDQQT
jgi:AcrR family transcriptional regulator